jgi:hypothetical protein
MLSGVCRPLMLSQRVHGVVAGGEDADEHREPPSSLSASQHALRLRRGHPDRFGLDTGNDCPASMRTFEWPRDCPNTNCHG